MGESSKDRGALTRYLRDIRRFSVLSKEQEQRLRRQIGRGETDGRSELVRSNLGFVVKIASEYRNLGVPFEDLLNEGNLGLIEAAQRYDPSRETRFTTYAVWWIRKKILHAIGNRSLLVRVPASRRRMIAEVKKTADALSIRLGRAPTREEIAGHLSIPTKRVDSLLGTQLAHASLDRPADAEKTTPPKDLLADDRSTAEQELIREELAAHVKRAFLRLTPREQAVLGWRYALEGESTHTLQEIGERLNLSRERVRQIEMQARRRMRRLLGASPRAVRKA